MSLLLLFLSAVTMGAPPQVEWELVSKVDPMTDELQARTTLTSTNGEGVLGIKCDEGKPGRLYIQLVSFKFLGEESSGETRVLTYRFDDSPAVNDTQWHYTSNSVYNFDNDATDSFVERIGQSKRLRVRAITYEAYQNDWEFDLSEAPAAMAKIQSVCARK